MFVLEKMLGLASIGGTLVGPPLLHRLVTGVSTLLALTIVCALMGFVLLMGGFYVGYLGLLHYGLDPSIAAMIVASAMALLLIALVTFLVIRLQRLREFPYSLHRVMPDMSSRVSGVLDAFMDGLMKRPPHH